jgi:hypothetical protein
MKPTLPYFSKISNNVDDRIIAILSIVSSEQLYGTEI